MADHTQTKKISQLNVIYSTILNQECCNIRRISQNLFHSLPNHSIKQWQIWSFS